MSIVLARLRALLPVWLPEPRFGRTLGLLCLARTWCSRVVWASNGGGPLREMFANTPSIALLVDPTSGAIIEANHAACEFYGYTHAELLRSTIRDINPNLTSTTAPVQLAAMISAHEERTVSSHRLASGETRDVEVHGSTLDARAFGRAVIYISIHDITEFTRMEVALHTSEARYRLMFEENTAVQLVADLETGAIVDVNPAALAFYGYTKDFMLGMNTRELSGLSPEERLERLEGVRTVNHHTFEQRHSLSSGEVRDVEVHLSLNKSGQRRLIYTIVHDITERKRAHAALAYQAEHDGLTGLPNRRLLLNRLEQAVSATQSGGPPVALLLLDLDRFKEVNDTLGHAIGDALLQQIAHRLQGAAPDNALVARLGGDEFAIILPSVDSTGAGQLAEVLVRLVRTPLALGSQLVTVDVSIGVAAGPEHAQDADTLLRCADVAMYQAKRSAGGTTVYGTADDEPCPNAVARTHRAA